MVKVSILDEMSALLIYVNKLNIDINDLLLRFIRKHEGEVNSEKKYLQK